MANFFSASLFLFGFGLGVLGMKSASGQTPAIEAQRASATRQMEAVTAAMSRSVRVQTSSLKTPPTARVTPELAAKPAAVKVMADLKHGGRQVDESFFASAGLLPAPMTAFAASRCEALAPARIEDLVDRVSHSQGVNPELLRAVMRQESAFYPCAVSQKGAIGLMQLMPRTASEMGVYDALDPLQNITGGARLLRSLLSRYSGDIGLTLGAYNAGPGKVDAAGGIPAIPETTMYVRSILADLGISPEQD